MRFNKFVWELYKQSKRGQKAIARFSYLDEKFIEEWCRSMEFDFDDEEKEQFQASDFSMNIPELIRDSVSGITFKEQDAATNHYTKTLVENFIPFKFADKTGKMIEVAGFPYEETDGYDYVAAVSLGLYQAQPNYFLPYNFRTKFNQVEEIHTQFNIPLPAVPGKNDKDGRSLYYIEINRLWQEFRLHHGLSPIEMCAFLYDFAQEFITPMNADDLPSPSKAWLITGGSWDIETVDNATPNLVIRWSGNPGIRRGDILMMYLVSPRKSIGSIWRACSDGFIDPFFHYHGTVWICNPVKTEPVTFAELKQHSLLSQKPAVRANFQGSSGRTAFTFEEYEAILKIMQKKGQNLTLLPRLPLNESLPEAILLNERDVEVQLIEPFIKRLDYKNSDWVRQMPVKMGRGECYYPDYAFAPKTRRGEESAKMVLESKFQLSAQKAFEEAFFQTKSYALRLQSKIMAMAAKEGVWVFPKHKGTFDIKNYIQKSWAELAHPDGFHEVLIWIGRDKVLKK